MSMKILIAGDWHSELHEEAIYNAFIRLGHRPVKFAWHNYFKSSDICGKVVSFFQKIQNKYMVGPLVNKMNCDLIVVAERENPDLVFIYRGSHILPKTLLIIRRVARNAIIVGYNNDDPFSPHYPRWMWRHFIAGVPEYDLVLAYRLQNLDEYMAIGARRVELLRSWFITERNYPAELTDAEKLNYECDVVFVGHYEDDGRLECLENIARHGWKLRIFGPGYEWNHIIQSSEVLNDHNPVDLVWGKDYNLALCGAKVALCFFSKLNRDTYTRRCFEIPASGSVLMSEHSDDLASMFESDQEAVYFHNSKELCEKLELLFCNEEQIKKIAAEGKERVLNDGHDVISRMKTVISWVDDIRRNTK